MPGLIDETLIIGGFVYWVGPMDVFYSLKHAYKQWIAPKIEPHAKKNWALLRAAYLNSAPVGKPKEE